jgi:protein TonB
MDRAVRPTPIILSLLLHGAVLAPLLFLEAHIDGAGGIGSAGVIVSLSADGGVPATAGTDATPALETIRAAAPEAVSAAKVQPQEIATVPAAEVRPAAEAETIEARPPEAMAAAAAEPQTPDSIAPETLAATAAETVRAQAPPETAPAQPVPPEAVAELPSVQVVARTPPTAQPVEAAPPAPPPVAHSTPISQAQAGERDGGVAASPAGQPGDDAAAGSGAETTDNAALAGAVDYRTLLQAWLERHKRYPRRAKLRQLEGTAMLYFAIDREGHLLSYRIDRSSGHALLDEEVEALIRRAAPLPPAPTALSGGRLEFVLPVRFALK